MKISVEDGTRQRTNRARWSRWIGLSLVATGAGACTSILGGFDYDGSAASTGSGGSTASSSGTTTTASTGTTASSGSGGAMTCAGGAATCGSEVDCPATASSCVLRTCLEGCCGVENAPVHTAAPSADKKGDCHRAECDGHGASVQLVDDTDLPDDGETCTDDACTQGSPSNTPVMGFVTCAEGNGHVCGNPFGDAGDPTGGTCVACNADADCTSPDQCVGHACLIPSCTDMLQDGAESDIDCGGPKCPSCADGKSCFSSSDCASASCGFSMAGSTCAPASCTDFIKNVVLGETDIDCGGLNCPACATGFACLVNADCLGGKCSGNLCAPTCTDGQHNGGETDVDCGGPCAKKCAFQKACSANSDCITGWCNPQLGSCDAEILAQNQAAPQAIAVDATSVYWISYAAGTVMKLPLGTNTPITLASGQGPGGVAIDAAWPSTATFAYWTSVDGGVKRRRVDLSLPLETLATSQNLPGAGIAVDGSAVYWANDGDGTVRKFLFAGATVQPLATLTQCFTQRLVTTGSSVYWTNAKGMNVYSVPLGGGAAQPVVAAQQPIGVAVDGVSVYWSDAAAGSVWKQPVGGGSATHLAMGLSSPWAIAIDSNNVYTFENLPHNSRILEISSTFGTTKVLVSGVDQPGGIAVDNNWVYFTAGDNTVRRVLK